MLERLGPLVVDRPLATAPPDPPDPSVAPEWAAADLRYRRWRGRGQWSVRDGDALPNPWTMRHADLTFELRPTDSGQVGFFADQIANWRWLAGRVRPGSRLLNLFAYTGGSTLVAARAGASVTHVDAARPAVAWARRNAELSGLAEAPVRWIVDDALAFAERELRRGRSYDGIVLDPPSYGHGRGGRRWQLAEQLPALLGTCGQLLRDAAEPLLLLSAHTAGLDETVLAAAVTAALGAPSETVPLALRAATGRSARAGWAVRWPP